MKAKKVLDSLLEGGDPLPYALVNCQPPENADPLVMLVDQSLLAEKARRIIAFCSGVAIAFGLAWIWNQVGGSLLAALGTTIVFVSLVTLTGGAAQKLFEHLPGKTERFWLNYAELVTLLEVTRKNAILTQQAPEELRAHALDQFKEYARTILWMRQQYGEGSEQVRRAETVMRRAYDLFLEYNLLPSTYANAALAYREAFEWANAEIGKAQAEAAARETRSRDLCGNS